MIALVLRNLVGVIGALWLGLAGIAGGVWWEHRPSGWPNLQVGVLWLHWRLGFGDGLAAQLAQVRPQLLACVANQRTLTLALDRQSAAVAASAAAGRHALAEAESAVSQGRSALAAASRRAAVLAEPIAGADECARVRAVDRRFVGGLG